MIIMVCDVLQIRKSVKHCGKIDLSKLSKSVQFNCTFSILFAFN